MSDPQHFEELWRDAEKASEPQLTPRAELFIQLKQAFNDYAQLDAIPSNDIQNVLKTKKLGEVLYRIAELSRVDNINVFAALQMEVQCAINKTNE